jgi:hypothetical protein
LGYLSCKDCNYTHMRGNAPRTSERLPGGRILTEPDSESRQKSIPSDWVPNRLANRTPQIEIGPLDDMAIVTAVSMVEPNRGFKNGSRVLGVAGTLLLHGLVFNFGWSFPAHKAPPEPKGIGTSRSASIVPPTEELILLNLDSARRGESDLQSSIDSLIPPIADVRIEVAPPQPAAVTAALETGGAATASSDVGDPALRALLFGHYTGQISARIQRAWVRPRTPVNDGVEVTPREDRTGGGGTADKKFKCRVQIRQDTQGNVQEVLLLECNGTEAWRHSLIVAINQSSPLPAPPSPSVFSRAMTMSFEAEPYYPGGAGDAYEREPAEAVLERVAWRPTGAPARAPNPDVLIRPRALP